MNKKKKKQPEMLYSKDKFIWPVEYSDTDLENTLTRKVLHKL